MTRKDYILLAEAIKRHSDRCIKPDELDTIYRVANEIATALQQDNPRFDYERFMIACGALEDVKTGKNAQGEE